MTRIKSIIVVTAIAAFAAACSTDYASVRDAENQGSAFHQGLQSNYALLANMEYNEMDWSDTDFFVNRAAMAVAGQDFGPQDSTERSLPEDMAAEAAREGLKLTNMLNAGGRDIAPQPASRAQAMYDCWLQELEENIQPDHIAKCKADYDAAYKKLLAAMKPAPAPAMPAPKPMPKAMSMPGPFVIYFGHDSAKIENAARVTIRVAAAAMTRAKAATLILAGHTDTSGASDYNVTLSQTRALAVAEELRGLGVADAAISVTAFGEERPSMKTGDNAKEKQNRRTVITLK